MFHESREVVALTQRAGPVARQPHPSSAPRTLVTGVLPARRAGRRLRADARRAGGAERLDEPARPSSDRAGHGWELGVSGVSLPVPRGGAGRAAVPGLARGRAPEVGRVLSDPAIRPSPSGPGDLTT